MQALRIQKLKEMKTMKEMNQEDPMTCVWPMPNSPEKSLVVPMSQLVSPKTAPSNRNEEGLSNLLIQERNS